jgi:translation initiation factor IF-2
VSNKVRVYELAKEAGLENRDVLRRLTELGIEAKSHSSSVSTGDAQRFRESLGKTESERRADEEARKRREQEELERYRALAERTQAPPEAKKAAKVLPPHLRKQQEEAERAAAAAAATGPVEAPEAPPAEAPAAAAEAPSAPPAPGEPTPPPAGEGGAPGTARRMPGAPPPRLVKGEVPLRPARPGGGGPSAPPTVTGESPEARRKVELNLPKEGSGKRHIPPPLRQAPARPQPPAQPVGRGGPGGPGGPGGRGGPGGAGGRGGPGGPGGRGGPGGPGGGGGPSSPYRQPVGRGGPGGGPGGPGGAPGGPGGAPGGGRGKRKGRREKTSPEEQELLRGPRRRDVPIEEQIRVQRVAVLPGVTVGELADKLGVPGGALVKKLFQMGEMATVQQTLPDDTVEILGAELGFEVYFMSQEEAEFGIEAPEAPEALEPRPPVITVMGHVDHGKTLLLDAIRETDVVSGEAGGITQHIGAYQITKDDRAITFIDTPGHAAFTAMRARGAEVTDIVILVVAANDGVMPQTIEAIQHAKVAGVPIVVAVNKMDLPEANPDKVKGQLAEHEVIVEEYGGEVPAVHVSAKGRQGLDDLLEVVLLQADLLELKANPNKDARGRVIEAHLDKGRGPVATVLVQAGTLRRGDILVAGTADGRIRAMFDENGTQLDEAPPARPVQVLGLSDVPEAGDEFRVVDEERLARDVAERRATRERRAELASQARPKTLEELTAEVQEGEKAVLNVVIKADVSGSAEALEDALGKMDLDEVRINVVGKSVGAITEGDVGLAEISDGIIIGFNVRPGAKAREAIERSGVDVRLYKIIYEALEDIERAVKGLLGPEFREQIIGEAEVREIFKVPRVGFVYGCMVTRGEVKRDAGVRVIRDGVVVAEDTMSSLRRFKDDAREVREGFECGIGLNKFQDVKVGDVIEAYETVEVERA